MAVTKGYVDAMVTGISWHSSQPTMPVTGDCYNDINSQLGYIFDGNTWMIYSSNHEPPSLHDHVPTKEQLEKHPALKQAWEEFLVIKRLLGV